MTQPPPLPIFDAHLDLAYLALRGRDMLRTLDRVNADPDNNPHHPASVTLPEMAAANIRYALGTVFTAPGDPSIAGRLGVGPEQFSPGDVESAHLAGAKQIEVYHHWAEEGLCRLATHATFADTSSTPEDAPSLVLGVLMENADPIRTPDELPYWTDRGLVAVSLTWAVRGRYACGNAVEPNDDTGVSPLGRELLEAMQEEKLVLDVSHLADRSLADALDRFGGTVIASHSNCRALAGTGDATRDQRHLTDASIRAIARRGGVIGLNLCKRFIKGGPGGIEEHPSLDDAVDHIERICDLTGSVRHAGIGSDLDGGFSADDLPNEIRRASDMQRIFEKLAGRGFSTADLLAIANENWLRVFARN